METTQGRSTRAWSIVVITVILLTCLALSLCCGMFTLLLSADSGASGNSKVNETRIYGEAGGKKVLSLVLSGVILGDQALEGSGGLFSSGGAYGQQLKDQILAAAGDEQIAAVVLEINSPGGTIYGSNAIADGVTEFKKLAAGKPFYVHINAMAASGGYMAAARADKILAEPGSQTGSIGVISGPYKYYNRVVAEDGGLLGGGVVTEGGIESRYYTAGGSKDTGSPYRRLSAEEEQVLQKSLDNEYGNFVKLVAGGRKLSESEIRNTIKAHLYDNAQALSLKLIDGVATREQAYEQVAAAAGLEAGQFQVIRRETELGFFDILLGASTQGEAVKAALPKLMSPLQPLLLHGDPAHYFSL